MKFDENLQIVSMRDVAEFTVYCYRGLSVSLHPDDAFIEYIDVKTKQPAFTPKHAKLLDRRMDECFQVCEKHDMDIYDFMLNLYNILCEHPEYTDLEIAFVGFSYYRAQESEGTAYQWSFSEDWPYVLDVYHQRPDDNWDEIVDEYESFPVY